MRDALVAGLLAAGLLTSAGCWPVHARIRDAYRGTVVDADTGRPVAGATIVVESWEVSVPPASSHWHERMRSFETRTDVRGGWHVPEDEVWRVGILAADGLPFFTDTYCLRAAGYAGVGSDPWSGRAPDGNTLWAARPPRTIALRRAAGHSSARSCPSRARAPER